MPIRAVVTTSAGAHSFLEQDERLFSIFLEKVMRQYGDQIVNINILYTREDEQPRAARYRTYMRSVDDCIRIDKAMAMQAEDLNRVFDVYAIANYPKKGKRNA